MPKQTIGSVEIHTFPLPPAPTFEGDPDSIKLSYTGP